MKKLVLLLLPVAVIVTIKSWYLIDPHYQRIMYSFTRAESIKLENVIFKNRSYEEVQFSSVFKPYSTVYFWASWCRPCLVTIRELASKQEDEFLSSIVLVSLEDDVESTLSSISELELQNPMYFGTDEMYDSGYFGNNVKAIPYSIVLNGEGAIKARALGSVNISEMWSTTINKGL